MRENNEIDGKKTRETDQRFIHSFIMDNCQLLSSSSSFGCHLKLEWKEIHFLRTSSSSMSIDFLISMIIMVVVNKKTSTGTNIMKMKWTKQSIVVVVIFNNWFALSFSLSVWFGFLIIIILSMLFKPFYSFILQLLTVVDVTHQWWWWWWYYTIIISITFITGDKHAGKKRWTTDLASVLIFSISISLSKDSFMAIICLFCFYETLI